METALSLGSNLGNRFRALTLARNALCALPGTALLAQSPVYETEPVGVCPDHRDKAFLNAVIILDCTSPPDVVVQHMHAIEDQLGRQRTPGDRYAPRTLDIDMLYYGNLVLNTPELVLPHPQCLKRRFVCAPLADLRPGLVLPGSHQPLQAVLTELPSRPTARRLNWRWPDLP